MKLIEKLQFKDFTLNERKETLTSIDATGKFILKIHVKKNPRKINDLENEFEIMRFLNEKRCMSCPTAHEFGDIDLSTLKMPDQQLSSLGTVNYIIEEFVPHSDKFTYADVLLSLLEQRSIGIYQGDIKPANIRFNSATGVCVFIDYDQAILLDESSLTDENVNEFLKFCDDYDRERYGVGNWLRHFHQSFKTDCVVNGRLDLSETSLLKTQKTTNSESGIYHTIDAKDVFAKGSRTLDTRKKLLDKINFNVGEKVLDVGCNAGLLSTYLCKRGCNVTGVDNDPSIVIAAQMLANIVGDRIEYKCLDIDFVKELEQFDTIMLFSVFHHTRDLVENAKKIARSCKRIIIETRLVENGKQPVDGKWVNTNRWEFSDLQQLTQTFEKMFDGFKFQRNVGVCDKNRFILEFEKTKL